MIGSASAFGGDPLTSLEADDDEPEMTSSTARDDDVLLLAPSTDVHDISVIVQLTHGNVIALWSQLMYDLHYILTSFRRVYKCKSGSEVYLAKL